MVVCVGVCDDRFNKGDLQGGWSFVWRYKNRFKNAFAPAGRVDDIGVWVILDVVVGSLSDSYFPVAPLLYETMDLNHKPVTDEATIVSLVPLLNTQIKLQFKKVGSLENLVLQKVMETMPDVAREQLPHLFDGYEEQITVMEINH
jgi:hypothetical protein